MAGTPCNALNINQPGLVNFDGTATFSGVTLTQYDILVGGASNSISSIGPGTSGQLIQSKGAGVNPAYTTATYPSATTVNQLLYSISSNVIGGVTAGNNGVLISGTTGTPSWLANGTAGYLLTAQSGAPPAWAAAAAGGFTTVVTQVFTSTGTYTPTANMKYCIVQVVGGGGGGGGQVAIAVAHSIAIGSGGGGGGYSRKTVSAGTIGVSQTVTIGAAGAAGAAGNNAGGNGGTTSLGAIVSATGGTGGSGGGSNVASVAVTGAVGGAGSSGDFNIGGSPGTPGFGIDNVATASSFQSGGGGSFYGQGGIAQGFGSNGTGTAGSVGTGYGAGGSGAGGSSGGGTTTATAGAAGTAGIVIITEYI